MGRINHLKETGRLVVPPDCTGGPSQPHFFSEPPNMLTVHLIAVLLSQSPDALLGEVGESCRARADCRSGLKCINSQCTAPVAVSTKEGQACEATPDCSSDGSLRCIAKVCSKPRSAAPASSLSPPPSVPAYVPTNAQLSDAPAPVTRSATLSGQVAPSYPGRELAQVNSQQILQLETEIDSLNSQLRGIETGWPGGSIALVIVGSLLSPLTIVGFIVTIIFPAVGVPVLLLGLGGVAMIIVGAVGGSRVAADALAEKEALIQKREAAERELNHLKRMGAVHQRVDAAMVTVATF